MKINNYDPITGIPTQRSQSYNAQMMPASQPSGDIQAMNPKQSTVQPTVADIQIQNLVNQYDRALEDYSIQNLFDYERTCKQIFMRGLIQAPHPSSSFSFKNQQDRRAQMQKLMNFKFLKFQMKEKNLKKQIFANKQKEFEIRELNKLNEYPKYVDQRQEDDLGFQFITKSRRKAVDPLQALKDNSLGRIRGHSLPYEKAKNRGNLEQLTEQGQNPYQNINLQNQAIQEQPVLNTPQLQQLAYAPSNQIPPQAQLLIAPPNSLPMALPYAPQEMPQQPLVVGRNLEPQDCSGFLARFSNDDFIKQQKVNLQKIQKQVLEQQIKEKQLKKNQEKMGEVKTQNQQVRNYSKDMHARRQSHFSQGQDLQPVDNKEFLREAPGEQINYLANSNNMHHVLNSQFDKADPLRNGVNAVVRGGSPDNSRQILSNDIPAGNFGGLEQQMNYVGGAQTDVAQNMHIQAMDFIGVLKDLIQDTVSQQRQINQNMFPQPQYQQMQTPVQNYHEQQQQLLAQQVQQLLPQQPAQEEKLPEPTLPKAHGSLQQAAAKHTNMIQTYIKEIGGLQQQKEKLIMEESNNILEQRSREPALKSITGQSIGDADQATLDRAIEAKIRQGLKGPEDEVMTAEEVEKLKLFNKVVPDMELVQPLDQTFAGNGGFQIDNNAASALNQQQIPLVKKVPQQATMPLQVKKVDEKQVETFLKIPLSEKPIITNAQKTSALAPAAEEKKEQKSETKTDVFGNVIEIDQDEEERLNGIPDKNGRVGYAQFKTRPKRMLDQNEKHQAIAEAREAARKQAEAMAEAHGAVAGEFDHAQNYGPNGEGEVKQNVKNLVDDATQARLKAEDDEQRKLLNDFLNDSGESRYNMAQEPQLPSQKINQQLMEQVWNNFEKYDDFKIFERGVPSSVLKPLRPDLTNNPEYPNPYKYRNLVPPDVYDPDIPKEEQHAPVEGHEIQARLIRQTFNPTYSIFDARMRENIDNVMKENFEFEQKTIETLFNRYQQYKPIVSGVYGQDVVHTTDHLHDDGKDEDLPANVKEYETQELIERMKGNHKTSAVDLAERYTTIEDAHQMFSGRPRREAIDIIEQQPLEQDQPLSANDILDPTVKGFRFNQIKQRNDGLFSKEEGINLGTVDEVQAENEDEQNAENEKKLLNPGENALFPFQKNVNEPSQTEIDSKKIQDRILTLKLMFEDTKTLRQQKDFLNSKGANVLTAFGQEPENIELIQQYNTEKQLQNQLLGTRIGAGLENEPNQKGTRMISSIIKDVKEQKAMMEQNIQLQQDFEGQIQQKKDIFRTSEFFQPQLTAAGQEINAYMPESVQQKVVQSTQLPEGHPLAVLQNDFRFDFNEYDAHRQQIRDEAIIKNSKNDECIQDLIAQKLDVKPTEPETILDQLVEQSKDLQIQKIVEDNRAINKSNVPDGQVTIAGTDFTYKPIVEDQKENEEPIGDRSLTTEPKVPNYGFLARNVYVEQLGDPNKELKGIKDIFLFKTQDGANTDQMFKFPEKKPLEPEPITFGQEALDPVVSQAKKAFDVPIFAQYQPYADNRDKLDSIQKALANKSVFSAADDPTFQGQLNAQKMEHFEQKKIQILLKPPDHKILQNQLEMKSLNEQLTEIKEKQLTAQDAQLELTIALNQKEVANEFQNRQNDPQATNIYSFRNAQSSDHNQRSQGSQFQQQLQGQAQVGDSAQLFKPLGEASVPQSEPRPQSPKFQQQTPSEPQIQDEQLQAFFKQYPERQPLSQPVPGPQAEEPGVDSVIVEPTSQDLAETGNTRTALSAKSDSMKNGLKEKEQKLKKQATMKKDEPEGPEYREILEVKTQGRQSTRQSEREQLRIDMLRRIEKKKHSDKKSAGQSITSSKLDKKDKKSAGQSQLEGGQHTKRELIAENYQSLDAISLQNYEKVPQLDIDGLSVRGSINNFEPPSSTRSQKQLNVLKDPKLNSLRRMHSQTSLDSSLALRRPPIQKNNCAKKIPKFTKTGSKNLLPPIDPSASLHKKLKTLEVSKSDPNLSIILSKKIQNNSSSLSKMKQTNSQHQLKQLYQPNMKDQTFSNNNKFNFNEDPNITSKIKFKQIEYKKTGESDDQQKVSRVKLRLKKYQNSFINDLIQQS